MQVGGEILERLVAAARLGGRRELVHGFGHGAHVLQQVDAAAVVEEAAPLRIETHQLDMVGQPLAGLGEDPLQDARHG